MSNPTIEISLSSLTPGTVPSVTQSVSVSQGGQLDITVSWPSSGNNTITVDLKFIGGDQDPFNDQTNGDTNFQLTRASNNVSATKTLNIMGDATFTADSYCLTLTIDGQDYSTDPTIIIDPD